MQLGVFGQLQQVRRWEGDDADAMAMHRGIGLFRAPQAVIAHHQAAAMGQRSEPTFMGAIERK